MGESRGWASPGDGSSGEEYFRDYLGKINYIFEDQFEKQWLTKSDIRSYVSS